MNTIIVPMKFQKGDTIYTTKQIKAESKCHVCSGTGILTYHDRPLKCYECLGTGILKSNKFTNIVCDDTFTISSTKISINSHGVISVKHKGYCGHTQINRSEDNLFYFKEEAQARCDELNQEKIEVEIRDIIIQDSFKLTSPSIDKISDKLNHYRLKGKFDKDIAVNRENILVDGYVTYLLCQLLGVGSIKVKVRNT
jgi:hypothetical protein